MSKLTLTINYIDGTDEVYTDVEDSFWKDGILVVTTPNTTLSVPAHNILNVYVTQEVAA